MSQEVKPKKSLGQHFLNDPNTARKIVSALVGHDRYGTILEVGPGTGVLSEHLLRQYTNRWLGVDVDTESIRYLKKRFPEAGDRIIEGNFLHLDLAELTGGQSFGIIGNFPYNISSQILFKILDNRQLVPEVVGMFQKEVAQRIASPPGSKTYGILSVLTQAFYRVRILFHVEPHLFIPPPKVQSSVLRMELKDSPYLDCDEALFFRVVKAAFNQRRKTLRNSLRSMDVRWEGLPANLEKQRPEQLGVEQFVAITRESGTKKFV